MSLRIHNSRKSSIVYEDMTSRTSSGFAEDFNFRPDTAPTKLREQIHPTSPLVLSERPSSIPTGLKMTGSQDKMSAREILQSAKTENSSIGSKIARRKSVPFKIDQDQPWYMSMLKEKEDRLLRMGDEINRLSGFENEVKQKDREILELKKQLTQQAMTRTSNESKNDEIIADLKNRNQLLSDEVVRLGPFEEQCQKKDEEIKELRQKIEAAMNSAPMSPAMQIQESIIEVVLPSMDGRSTSLSDRLQDLMSENDAEDNKVRKLRESIVSASADADALKNQFDVMVPEKLTSEDEVILIKEELMKQTKLVEISQQQLDQAIKDLRMNDGFVNALQRDLQASENRAMKLAAYIEKCENKMNDAINDSETWSKKFSDLREFRKHNDIIAENEHEIILLKKALQELQVRYDKLKEKVDKQSKEIRDSHRKVRKGNELDKKQSEEIKNLCRDLEDLRRKEQLSRVSAEQVSSRFERLRSRIIQAVYITPGTFVPDTIISDTVVFNAVKKIVEERSEFHQKILETQPDFPPLQLEMDSTQEPEEEFQVTTNPERKSGKGGRKSPKHK